MRVGQLGVNKECWEFRRIMEMVRFGNLSRHLGQAPSGDLAALTRVKKPPVVPFSNLDGHHWTWLL